MKTLAVGHTESGAYWVFEFATREEALVFLDTAGTTQLPHHEAWDIRWDLLKIDTTTVDKAIEELKGDFREFA